MKLFLISIVLAFFSGPLVAAPYIVLFQEAQGIQPANYKKNSQTYKATNKKNIERLEAFLARKNSVESVKSDLWLIQGAAVELKAAERQELESQGYVKAILPDKFRRFLTMPVVNHSPSHEEPDGLWGLEALGVHQIREKFPFITGEGVRVGVLDTGLQDGHPEFEHLATPALFKDFVNGIPYSYDDHGHGTHVSGSIAGSGVGVAPGASLVVGKILSASGSAFDSWILEGMQWIFDPDGNPDTADHPHIVNNSWGANLPLSAVPLSEFEPFYRAVQSWLTNNIIPVFAAGNSGRSPNGFPAAFPDVLSIGAINSSLEIASFSSRGPNLWELEQNILSLSKPDFSAPGQEVYSAVPNNDYAIMSGTSMATPYAVGSIALLLQTHPDFGVKEVKQRLLETSSPKYDLNYGLGVINAYDLIQDDF